MAEERLKCTLERLAAQPYHSRRWGRLSVCYRCLSSTSRIEEVEFTDATLSMLLCIANMQVARLSTHHELKHVSILCSESRVYLC